MGDYLVKTMTEADLPQVLVIETMCFAAPWCQEHFRHELRSSLAFPLVATTTAGIIAGYICPMLVIDEGQVLTIAVHPDFQGKGIGRLLLGRALAEFHRCQSSFVALEVRRSNRSAIALYLRCGFRETGIRAGYYPDGEDALLMEYDMKQYGEQYNAV